MSSIYNRSSFEWSAEYMKYLESIKESLSPYTREFALAPWHYDPKDHRCPHDSWVESISISENASGETRAVREVEIVLTLLGAFHDLRIKVHYPRVFAYSIERTAKNKASHQDDPDWIFKRAETVGHGDLLVDQIRLSEDGDCSVIHEIEFELGYWSIHCSEIRYSWEPLQPKREYTH